MNIKKCSKCGWEYPADWPGRTCKFCRGPILNGYCADCGKWSESLCKSNWLCLDCRSRRHREWRQNKINKAEDAFSKWLNKISGIPTPYKTLTEEEWLEACKHFGGCAYCGSSSIDARSMFISFKDGGRYCSWNIIPACERCETAHKAIPNPFRRMNHQINRSNAHQAIKYGFSTEKLQKIVDYLGGKMNE